MSGPRLSGSSPAQAAGSSDQQRFLQLVAVMVGKKCWDDAHYTLVNRFGA
jgi:hypothetical protein